MLTNTGREERRGEDEWEYVEERGLEETGKLVLDNVEEWLISQNAPN